MPSISIPKCTCGHSDGAHSLSPACAFCTCRGFQLDHVSHETVAPRQWLRVATTNRQPLRS